MQTSVIGFPRIGALRELKFASEKYFRKEITAEELCDKVIIIRKGKVVCFDTVENLKKKYGGLSLEDSYLNIVGDGND